MSTAPGTDYHYRQLAAALVSVHSKMRRLRMSEVDWAKVYAEMDNRIFLKYQQLPRGEQIGRILDATTQSRPGGS
jgi:hypothetical protein